MLIKGDPAKVFAQKTDGTRLIHLAIALNYLETLHRALERVMPDEYRASIGKYAGIGDQQTIFILLCGAIAECLHTLQSCKGTVIALAKASGEDLTEPLKVLDDALNPEGDFRKRVKAIRDNVAFHWKDTQLNAAIAAFGGKDQML